MKRCSVPGCTAKHMARELCQKDYNAVYHATIRKGDKKHQGTLYPQAIVRVGVKGWGFAG